jgi:hypothetical protein
MILPKRIELTLEHIDFLLKNWPNVSYRHVAKIVGQIGSMHPVFENLAYLRSRMLQTFVNIRHYRESDWNANIVSDYHPLFAAAYGELCFWKEWLVLHNERCFWAKKPTCIAWTDASDFAVGGFAVKLKADLPAQSILTADNWLLDGKGALRKMKTRAALPVDDLPWQGCPYVRVRDESDLDPDIVQKESITHRNLEWAECATDSNERELLAACHLLESCAVHWRGEIVLLYMDNINAVSICSKGSSKCRLQNYAAKISQLCQKYCIDLRPVWIPRDLNFMADFLSKCFDFDDHQVTMEFFNMVVGTVGTVPIIDRFACNRTTKTPRFNSATYCPGTSGIDAFNYDWGVGGLNWLFPPLKLIGRVLYHLELCKGEGLLLIPQWKNAYFYPLLLQIQTTTAFKGRWVFNGHGVFIHGSDKTSYFGPHFSANVEVWHIAYNTC